MSTPTITDEQIAEIEAAAKDSKLNIYRPFGWAHSVRCGNHLQTDFEYLSLIEPASVLALISRLRAAERNAARYRWLCASAWYVGPEPKGDTEAVSWHDHNDTREGVTLAIDSAMARPEPK